MIVLALPVLDMRTWPQDPSTQSTDLTTRKAYDLVADEYGPGLNGPIQIVVDRDRVTGPETAELARELEARDDIAEVSKPIVSPDGAMRGVNAVPAFGPTDERSHGRWSHRSATQVPDGVEVTGQTPLFADIADLLAKRLWLVIGFVVGVSVLLLAMVFRSVDRPAEGGGDEPAQHRRGVRRDGRGLPVGLGHRACSASTTPYPSPAGCRC